MLKHQAYIDGSWHDAGSGDKFTVRNPATGEPLVQVARMNQGAGMTQTYVIRVDNQVIGYYSLCPGSIERESVVPRILKGISGHAAVPIILLARLAVDSNEHGKGLGPALLKDAFQRAINATVAIAIEAGLDRDSASDLAFRRTARCCEHLHGGGATTGN